jgi:hypothetical protein
VARPVSARMRHPPRTSPTPPAGPAATSARQRRRGYSTAIRPGRHTGASRAASKTATRKGWQPPALYDGEDYTEAGLAADPGLADGDPAMADAVAAYLDAASESLWHEAERLARGHLHPAADTCRCRGHLTTDASPLLRPVPHSWLTALAAAGRPPRHARQLRGSRHYERRQGTSAGKEKSPRMPESGKERKV